MMTPTSSPPSRPSPRSSRLMMLAMIAVATAVLLPHAAIRQVDARLTGQQHLPTGGGNYGGGRGIDPTSASTKVSTTTMNIVDGIATSAVTDVSSLSSMNYNGINNNIVDTARKLFDLPSPFNIYNDECASFCDGGFESPSPPLMLGHNDDINACPKCSEKYTPCNFCCYDGASSLKMLYFGCPGDLTFTPFLLNDDKCDDVDVDVNAVVDDNDDDYDDHETAPAFIDCECYDRLVNPTTTGPTLATVEDCEVYGSLALSGTGNGSNNDSDDDDTAGNHDWSEEKYFEVCIVSTTFVDGMGFVVDLTKPLPDILGLKHAPNDEEEDVSHNDDQVYLSSPQVTYFDTTCALHKKQIQVGDNIIIDNSVWNHWPYDGDYYPLFPGYGKFAGTCPTQGFIDFGYDGIHPLPESIDHYHGYPPSTSFYYKFVDGTSVGFWPPVNFDDVQHYLPSFSTCECACAEKEPSTAPTAVQSSSPSDLPSLVPSRRPSASPSANPTAAQSASPSDFPSAEPSLTPSVSPSANPTAAQSSSPSELPSAEPSRMPSASPSANPSDIPTSLAPSASPSETESDPPSLENSAGPSASESGEPTIERSFWPSGQPTTAPQPGVGNPGPGDDTEPSLEPTSEATAIPTAFSSEPPTYTGSVAPTATSKKGKSAEPSQSPSNAGSTPHCGSPTATPSEITSTPSESPAPAYSTSLAPTGASNAPTASTVSPMASPTDVGSNAPSPSTASLTASPSDTSVSPSVFTASPTTSPTDSGTIAPSPFFTDPPATPSTSPSTIQSSNPSVAPSSARSSLTDESVEPSSAPLSCPETVTVGDCLAFSLLFCENNGSACFFPGSVRGNDAENPRRRLMMEALDAEILNSWKAIEMLSQG